MSKPETVDEAIEQLHDDAVRLTESADQMEAESGPSDHIRNVRSVAENKARMAENLAAGRPATGGKTPGIDRFYEQLA